MNIAIAGTRGIPANYGGFETFAEELSRRLVARGHAVTVYGRSNNVRYHEPTYLGVRLIILPTIPTKHLDTVAHTFLSVLHAVKERYDVMLICNAANAVFSAIPRMTLTPVALNVDGIERKRRKWGPAGRTIYRISERLATFLPTAVVTDAEVIHDYFLKELGKESAMIAYGADCRRSEETGTLESLDLQSGRYLLFVSRLEPENNAHLVVEAYRNVDTSMPLVIVGDAPYSASYIDRLKSAADERVRFPGAIYGERYLELRSHAYAYVQATEVGGTHPALLEAMGAGNCILANDTAEHREVLGSTGLYFNGASELTTVMRRVLEDDALVKQMRSQARARAKELYSWDAVTDQYEELFANLARS